MVGPFLIVHLASQISVRHEAGFRSRGSKMATFVSLLLAMPGAAAALFPDCGNGPLRKNTVCDTSASVRDRATALVKAMNIDEKFSQTGNTSPGALRLGLPAYQWWQKALVSHPFQTRCLVNV